MQDVGNGRAVKLYGGVAQRPRPGATDSEWLFYLKEKYEKRKWATHQSESDIVESKSPLRKRVSAKHMPNSAEKNLLDWGSVGPVGESRDDFFSQFGV